MFPPYGMSAICYTLRSGLNVCIVTTYDLLLHISSESLFGLPQVSKESIINKMSPSNLACVFGVNLVWPRHGSVSLVALTPINIFTEILIEHFLTVFGSHRLSGEVLPWTLSQVCFPILQWVTVGTHHNHIINLNVFWRWRTQPCSAWSVLQLPLR